MNQTALPLILVVEDEERLADLVGDYLRAAGFRVHHLATGTGAVAWIEREGPDLILLDLMLPGQDGLSICREVRSRSEVPVIMTTARVEEIDRLLGLELGADDYVCKPYSPRELTARVKAVLRRTRRVPEQRRSGFLTLEPERLQVSHDGKVITLTAVELALLAALHQAAGRILSRNFLMDRIYSDNRVVSDRTIDSHIKKLRRRLAELAPNVELIHSVYGVGYRYEEPDVDGASSQGPG
ncbi:response regulator [Thiocapsa marina]|uniref:Two component transcriptional regulator, winged helix family n=1 Tax=Thiocapsa marina 5811 TaxID=768671 RepID=F9U939_9GAMM|nr:response regulator [Thiocapsa marina]EGV19297.1 two component transcriptional regulator, winged helix family [Thiocapsa marina 5811]